MLEPCAAIVASSLLDPAGRQGPPSLAGWGRALRLTSPQVKVVRGMRQAGGGAPQYHQCERPSTHAFVSLVLSSRIRNLFMVFKSCVLRLQSCDTRDGLACQFLFFIFILKASSKFLCKGGGSDTFRAFLTHEGKCNFNIQCIKQMIYF